MNIKEVVLNSGDNTVATVRNNPEALANKLGKTQTFKLLCLAPPMNFEYVVEQLVVLVYFEIK